MLGYQMTINPTLYLFVRHFLQLIHCNNAPFALLKEIMCVCVCVCICVCVCHTERQTDRQTDRQSKTENKQTKIQIIEQTGRLQGITVPISTVIIILFLISTLTRRKAVKMYFYNIYDITK